MLNMTYLGYDTENPWHLVHSNGVHRLRVMSQEEKLGQNVREKLGAE